MVQRRTRTALLAGLLLAGLLMSLAGGPGPAAARTTPPTHGPDLRGPVGVHGQLARGQEVRILVVGSSTTEGVGLAAPERTSYLARLQSLLRARFGFADRSTGDIDAAHSYPSTPEAMSRRGTVDEHNWVWGVDGSAALLAPGSSTTTVGTGSRIVVRYGTQAVIGAQARISVDGVDRTSDGRLSNGARAGATINGALTHPDGARGYGVGEWSLSVPPGHHRVRVSVSGRAGRRFVLTSVEFRSSAPSVRVYGGGHAGALFRNWINPRFSGVTTVAPMWQEMAAIDPDLVVVNMLANEETHSTPARTKADVRAWLARAHSALPRDVPVVVVLSYMPGGRDPARWQAFRTAVSEAAHEAPHTTVWDLAALWPALTVNGSTNAGLMAEQTWPTHPSALGHARIAEGLADLLSERLS